MAKVVVLGGCGAVGSQAVRALAGREDITELVIGDVNEARAEELIGELGAELRGELGGDGVTFARFDAGDAKSVAAVIAGSDVVLNCVGPFYKTVKTVLGAVIDAGINYVDVCDDVDVTLDILNLDEKAKAAGITALIGMGASPGATNLLAKLAYETFLDETESIDIFHTHGGEPIEGAGVIGHRFHCMSIDIPMFINGDLQYVKYFEEDGIALRQTFDFPKIGKDIPIFPYPHPEQVTLPRYLDVKRVTNKGSVLPIEYYNLTGELCRVGLASKEAVEVNGVQVVPHDFAVAYLIRERERILRETDFGEQRGCMSIVVAGKKGGEALEVRIHLASSSKALGEGTGIPAAMGVMLMLDGKLTGKGVMPPEACVAPADFLALWNQIEAGQEGSGSASGGEKEQTIFVELVDAAGRVTKIDM